MTERLAVAAAQPETVPHAVATNAAFHAEAIRAAGARVIVFPELSLTGYEFAAAPLSPDDPRLQPIHDACRVTGSVALAGAPVLGPKGARHIAMLRFDGVRCSVAYHKCWLGEAETAHFSPGVGPVVIDVDGWRLGLAICKDTGTAEHAATTAALGIDAYVAGALEHAVDRDVQPTRAVTVATTHKIWVVIAGYAGPAGEGFTTAAGGSGVWAPDGSVVTQAGSDPGELVTATLLRR